MVTYRRVQPPVTILGLGVISAFGTSHDAFRDALMEGRTGVTSIKSFDTEGCRTTLGAPVTGFEPSAWISPMKLRRMDPTAAYAVAAARLAVDDARWPTAPTAAGGDDNAGVVLGTWTGGGQVTQEYLAALFRGGPSGAPALLFNSTVANAAASLAALEFGFRGPNTTLTHKEASGLAAIVTGVELVRAQRASGLVTGGVDALYEIFFKTHDRFRVMAPGPEFSRGAAPFDRERAGFVLGEGGYALWIERGDGWHARGAVPYGEILGIGASSAAVPINAWPDKSAPLVRTMRLALEDAGLRAEDVHVVYASANATRTLDAVEVVALAELFGGTETVVTSIKGALGEFGASGGAACAAALLCGRARQVPPVAGLVEPDPEADSLTIAREATTAPGPIALVNSFASGGALFSAVLRAAW
jgi:3-oxoacyl-[acyl-carrier-protein] synthase II